MERRRLLTLAAVGFVVPIAGCLEEDIDIRISRVSAEPNPVIVGDPVEVTVRLGNWGEHEGTRTVALYVADEKWDEEEATVSGSIEDDVPGRDIPFEVDTTGFDTGTYELKATIEDDEGSEMLTVES